MLGQGLDLRGIYMVLSLAREGPSAWCGEHNSMERGVLVADAGAGSCVHVSLICNLSPASQHQAASLTDGSSYYLLQHRFASIHASYALHLPQHAECVLCACRDRNILQFLGASVMPEGIMLVTEFMEVGSLQGFARFCKSAMGCGRSACGSNCGCLDDAVVTLLHIDRERCTGHKLIDMRGLHAASELHMSAVHARQSTAVISMHAVRERRAVTEMMEAKGAACRSICASAALQALLLAPRNQGHAMYLPRHSSVFASCHSFVWATRNSACSWARTQCAGGSLPCFVPQPCRRSCIPDQFWSLSLQSGDLGRALQRDQGGFLSWYKK